MAKSASLRQAALAKARERRLELHAERNERDRRIETLVAEALELLDAREAAERAVATVNANLGTAMRRLLDEQVGVDGAAQLIGVESSEVRRLARTAARADTSPGSRPDAEEASEEVASAVPRTAASPSA